MVSERLAETPERLCDGVSGCLMTVYKRGSSFWVSSIISQLPPSSWTGSFENTCMFVLEAPVISFNPKSFFFFFFLSMMNYSGNVFQSCHQSGQTQRERVRPHPCRPREELVFSGSKKFQKKGFKARGCPSLGSEQSRYHTQAC